MLRPDSQEISADGEDVAICTVEVQDAQGRVLPITDNDITFKLTGAGDVIGTGNDWWRRDIDAMVLRDRNHPSVILCSIGNEIPERTQPRGVEIQKQLVDYIKSLDPTRPSFGR